MSTIKVDTIQDISGVVKPLPQVTCQINGITTTTIVGSVGVSSITDESTGVTTVSFSNAFGDAAYTSTTAAGQGAASAGSGARWSSLGAGASYGGTVYTTSQVRLLTVYATANVVDVQYSMLTCIST